MNGDVHVRFCVGLGGRFPGPTRLANTQRGADASAMLYSIVETAKANGLIPFDYLQYVLTELSNQPKNIDYLLPWNTGLLKNTANQ